MKTIRQLATILALVLAAPVGAVTINSGLTSGVLNTIEDQDREAYVDANKDGVISVGDVFVGWVRLDDFLPAGVSTNNQAYGVFSNQIIAVNPLDSTQLLLGTTTVAGLTLPEITGDPNTAGGMFAIYDRASPYSANLVLTSAPSATSIKDDNDFIISNGVLRLTIGLGASDTYFFVDTVAGAGVGSPNAIFTVLPASATVGGFVAGLDVLYNNTSFTYADAVVTLGPAGFAVTQVGVGNGAIRGAIGDGREGVFTNLGSYGTFDQCTVPDGDGGFLNVQCGTVTDADFFVVPTRIPEPGSLLLLGTALLALVVIRRRVRKV